MTREELIQMPEYWQELYENECWRLGIQPILTFGKPSKEKSMKQTIVTCDICGSTKNVKSATLPMYRKFDATDGRSFYEEPQIVFDRIDICEDCLRKSTNIFDQRVQGYGDISIYKNEKV